MDAKQKKIQEEYNRLFTKSGKPRKIALKGSVDHEKESPLNVDVPDELKDKFKKSVKGNGRTLKGEIKALLEQYVAENPVPDHTA